MSFRQRLQFWAQQKGPWTHILIAVGIAVLILGILMASCTASKGAVNTNAADIAETQTTLATVTNSVGTKASQAALEALESDITDALGDQAADISDLDERTGIAETKLAQARTDITTIQGQIAGVINSPLSATLAGTFGNYTMSVKSDEAGDFMAKVHLVYGPGAGNATSYVDVITDFYGTVNWSVNATVPQYVVVPTYDGTTWSVAEVWWDTGTFGLVADTEKDIDITCAGLDSAWAPGYAYVEVYQAL